MANKKKFKEKVTISLGMESDHKKQIEETGQNLTGFINTAIREKLKQIKKEK